jgi:hypothetical protein
MYDKTLTDIVVSNSKQCSGNVHLTVPTNARKIKGLWRCNDFRDMVKNYGLPFMTIDNMVDTSNIDGAKVWYKQNRFKDKYLVVQMIYDNLPISNEQYKIMIAGYDFYVQQSIR